MASPSCNCELPSGSRICHWPSFGQRWPQMWRYDSCLEWAEQMLDLYSLRESLPFFQSYRYKIAQFFAPNHGVHRLLPILKLIPNKGFIINLVEGFAHSSFLPRLVFSETLQPFLVVWMVCLFCSLICWRWMTRIILAATPRMTGWIQGWF